MENDNLRQRVTKVLEGAEKAKKLYDVLIRTFAVSIFIAVASVSGLAWISKHNHNDIEYVREHALNKEAFFNESKARTNYNQSVTRLVTDEDIKKVVEDFNKKMDEIYDAIMATQTEIVPRGASVIKNNKLDK